MREAKFMMSMLADLSVPSVRYQSATKLISLRPDAFQMVPSRLFVLRIGINGQRQQAQLRADHFQ
jgi:hypothetical protein